jgi:hypothetical protein
VAAHARQRGKTKRTPPPFLLLVDELMHFALPQKIQNSQHLPLMKI